MSLSAKNSEEDLESIDDPSGLSSNDDIDSESSDSGDNSDDTPIDFDTIVNETVIKDKVLRELIDSTDISSENLFGL